jgi:prefoldin subunit 5
MLQLQAGTHLLREQVQEICADIKKLDHAKTHLQTTISQLRKLQMLVTAVQQLEMLAGQLKYKEVCRIATIRWRSG